MQDEKDAFRRRLDAFSIQLEEAKTQWEKDGSLGDEHKTTVQDIEARQGMLHHRAASQDASVWKHFKDDFFLAFESITADFERLQQYMDQQSNKPK